METARCPKCGNPNVGLIKDGSEYFFKKHNNQKGTMCAGTFTKSR
jgi:hypothetical protein